MKRELLQIYGIQPQQSCNMTDADFIHKHIEVILDVPGDLSSGINGCVRESAYERVCEILKANGAGEPIIEHVIKDSEVETTYLVSNGK